MVERPAIVCKGCGRPFHDVEGDRCAWCKADHEVKR
jgi:rRNA maturation endonuclease Nob1